MWAGLGILVILVGVVTYIDQSAVARTEGKRIAEGARVLRQSVKDTTEIAADERARSAAEIKGLKAQLRKQGKPLPAKKGAPLCKPGCRLKW